MATEQADVKVDDPGKTVRKRTVRRPAALTEDPTIDDKVVKFFRGREKEPSHYFYTPEGNYEIRGAKGIPDTVIRREKRFVPLKMEELEEVLQTRAVSLKERERTYEVALTALRNATEGYRSGESTAETVVLANNAVKEASLQRTQIAYPERWITQIDSIAIQDILMQSDPYEKRKLPYTAYLFKHHDLPSKVSWGTYKERTATTVTQGGGDGDTVQIRFITDTTDPKSGHFHPYTVRPFIVNETEYCSPYQAYQAEKMKEVGNEELRKQLLGTRSGRTMHSIAIKEKRIPAMSQKLWEDVLFQYFYQNKDFAKELEETGTDKFHVMDKEIPAEYAFALESTRLRFRELGDTDVDHQEAKEKTITEEDQKKAKVGAIIRNFKKGF